MNQQLIDLNHSLINWSERNPDDIAVVTSKKTTSYYEFANDVKLTYDWLNGELNANSNRVGIVIEDEYWCWIIHISAWELGMEILSLREADSASIVSYLKLDQIICCNSYVSKYDKKNSIVFSAKYIKELTNKTNGQNISSGNSKQQCPDQLQIENSSEPIRQPSRVVLTSGTTGTTRCVLWDKKVTYSRIENLKESLTLNKQSKVYSLQHIGTTGGFRYPLACWRAGGTVILRGTDNTMRNSLAALQTANLVVMAPINLKMMLNAYNKPWINRQSRHIVLAGGRVSKAQLQAAQDRCASTISIAYGATESGAIATGPATLINRHPGAAGFIRDGVDVQIVDKTNSPLPYGQEGKVRIKSPYMVYEYDKLNSSSVYRGEEFKEGWFYPGDLGILSEDGFLAILGRETEIANFGGFKVSLIDIESKLSAIPGVKDLTALKLEFPQTERLGIVVVSDDKEIAKKLTPVAKQIVKSRTSVAIVLTSAIERNDMGKVPKQALAQKITEKIAQNRN